MVIDLEGLADEILDKFQMNEVERVANRKDYTSYQSDPVGFCEKEWGLTLTDDVKTMMESVLKYRVTIAVSGNATGKTYGAGAVSLWFKKVFPGSQVITAAAPPAERNLKKKLWGEIKRIIRLKPMMWNDYRITQLNITKDDDELDFIDGVTIPTAGGEEEKEAKFSGAHAPHILFVLDEGDAIPDEIFRAIDSCMSGGNAHLLVMFNPKRKAGAAYRMIREGRCSVVRLDALKHPNVLTGQDIIPGCVTRQQTVKRIHEQTSPLPSNETPNETCFEVPDFLVGCTATDDAGNEYPPLQEGWRKIQTPSFYYMVLGKYPAEGSNQLIHDVWIHAARANWELIVEKAGGLNNLVQAFKKKGIRPTCGMDVADEGNDYCTDAIRFGSFLAEVRKWRGMDTDVSANKAAEIHAEVHALQTNVESDGLGAGIAPAMGRKGYWHCHICNQTFMDKELIFCPDCEPEYEEVVRGGTVVEKNRKEMKWEGISTRKVIVGRASDYKTEMGTFGKVRDELWWRLREWLRTDPNAALPPSESLIEELQCPTYEVTSENKVKVTSKDIMRKLLGRSPDEADALIETFFKGKGKPRVRSIDHGTGVGPSEVKLPPGRRIEKQTFGKHTRYEVEEDYDPQND